MERTLRQNSFDGLHLEETVVVAGSYAPKYTFQDFCLCFLLEGGVTERRNGREYEHSPPSVTINTPGETQSLKVGIRSMRYLSIELSPEWIGARDERLLSLAPLIDNRDDSIISLYRKIYREFCQPDRFSVLAIESLLLEGLVIAARGVRNDAKPSGPAWIRQAQELIRDNPTADHTLSSIASIVGVHQSHLARVFRSVTGYTIGEFLRRTRIEKAKEKLLFSDSTLSEIAGEMGFFDQAHFTRVFKSIVGVPPGTYRDRKVP